MMIDYNEAMLIVDAAAQRDWQPEWGTLVVDREGFEDETHFNVPIGSQSGALILDMPIYLVSKQSGVLTKTSYAVDMDRIDAMTPVRAR